jgi:hypothetical protein
VAAVQALMHAAPKKTKPNKLLDTSIVNKKIT